MLDRTKRYSILIGAMLLLVGCTQQGSAHTAVTEVELAPFMGRLQVYSHKLGYSVKARNVKLAHFYLHEVEEAAEEIASSVPTHDGHDIANLVETMLLPAVARLEQVLDGEDWEATGSLYTGLIASCNSCHLATSHGFIQILPASGQPPFNQDFELPMAARPK